MEAELLGTACEEEATGPSIPVRMTGVVVEATFRSSCDDARPPRSAATRASLTTGGAQLHGHFALFHGFRPGGDETVRRASGLTVPNLERVRATVLGRWLSNA